MKRNILFCMIDIILVVIITVFITWEKEYYTVDPKDEYVINGLREDEILEIKSNSSIEVKGIKKINASEKQIEVNCENIHLLFGILFHEKNRKAEVICKNTDINIGYDIYTYKLKTDGKRYRWIFEATQTIIIFMGLIFCVKREGSETKEIKNIKNKLIFVGGLQVIGVLIGVAVGLQDMFGYVYMIKNYFDNSVLINIFGSYALRLILIVVGAYILFQYYLEEKKRFYERKNNKLAFSLSLLLALVLVILISLFFKVYSIV